MDLGIVAQQDNPRAAELADRIRRRIDATVALDASTADSLGRGGHPVGDLGDCDLVVSIGGDGTFLFAAREVTPTPIMGVNLGEVGFLNAVSPEEAVETVSEVVERFRDGEAECQELPQVQAEGDGWSLPAAVNEVAILGPQRGRNNGVGIEVRVDGELYSGSHADGVLVSTPTGSTAYNLSEGGPLVHPDVSAFLVTEMCAEGPMPSLAVPTDAEITVRIDEADHAFVVADGRTRERVDPPTHVTVRLADDQVRIAGPKLEFFAALGKLE
ncbi:NAD(+)/NADH kinase [Natronomonas salina]|uniref:NAD(+)/NADH kinase n=1 Tax=Natronomonas salina TaxID=1710540 RepID=UPI0015B40518|nr:NAD(+)/NADH kinase [Natronomonas salina]QLD90438.1 NAD(+)/NADH kinase [Natronomonas salina]